MSEDKKSLLGSFGSSYGTTNTTSRSGAAAADEEKGSRHSRIKSWHKHDSDIMTGGDHFDSSGGPSAFAPLVRAFSSGRVQRVAESAAEQGYEENRKRPVAPPAPAQAQKGGTSCDY